MRGSPLGRVTVSIGIAVARPSVGESEATLVRRADAALYEAKGAGRAQVCLAAEDDDDEASATPTAGALSASGAG